MTFVAVSHNHPNAPHTNFLFAIWILMAFILTNAYTGVFYSILTIPEYENSVDKIEEMTHLIDSDSVQLITSEIWSDHFSNANQKDNELYFRFGQHIRRFVYCLFLEQNKLILEL